MRVAKNPKKVKAIGLLSGGLDSILAAKLLQELGIEVTAVHFISPFFNKSKWCQEITRQLNLPLKIIPLGDNYLKIIRHPPHGYGKAINPCIDCHLLMIKETKKFAKKIGAEFIFTGEVLGERPMSQNRQSLMIIEKEAGLVGKLLRPLSAKLLPITEVEKKGLVDRNKLLGIKGRGRQTQIELAKKWGIKDYPTPSGGCLLTEKQFGVKLRGLFTYKKKISLQDLEILRIGRHFRVGNNKIIVGRNQEENEKLKELKKPDDCVFKVQGVPSPITVLQGPKTKKAIQLAAQLTARYSDARGGKIKVECEKRGKQKTIVVSPLKNREVEELRLKE